VLALFEALQLFDVYHSPWFVLLLLLLALNLIACSLDRFPAAWRQIRAGVSPARPELFVDTHPDRRLAAEEPPPAAADRLEALLGKRIGKVRRVQDGRGIYLAAQKGAFARLGVYGVHLGILLLIAGGIASGLFGLKGHVEIVEGGVSDTLFLAKGQSPRPLGFQIRCDRFVVEHYAGGMPKIFRSDLAFLRDGKVEMEGALLVNHPLDFGGLRFYQSSYGRLPGGRLSLSWTGGPEAGEGRDIHLGERFALPGGAGEVEVLRTEDNLMRMGPAVKLSITAPGKTVLFWVFQNIEQISQANPGLFEQNPLMNPGLFAPWRFALAKKGERYYTVLQAARDPGAPLVALGAALMIVGLIVVFFFAHRRLWAEVTARKDGSRIVIAGQTSRDPAGLESEIQRLLAAVGAAEELS
jgi:cytochrome c biogenesis protein